MGSAEAFHSQGGSRDCELGMPGLPVWVMTENLHAAVAAACTSPLPLKSGNARGSSEFQALEQLDYIGVFGVGRPKAAIV